MRRRARWLLALPVLAVPLHCGTSQAADLPSKASPPAPVPQAAALPGWSFALNLYGWGTGLSGDLRTLPPLPTTRVNIGFDQVLKNLNGALMASGEARYDRFIVFTDLIASKIAPAKSFDATNYPASVKLDSTSVIGLVAGGYRLLDIPRFSIDALAGVRGFALKNTLDLNTLPLSVSYSKSQQWADAVGGVRLRYEVTDKLYAVGIAFAGMGGAKYEWDLFGALGYRFSDRWDVFAGYRALKVDYKHGYYVYDALMQGPIAGVSFRF